MELIPFHTQAGLIDLAKLGEADVSALAISDALAKINRFNGRTQVPWSVAAHSLLVETLCAPIDLKGWALLHDAHEAFIGDITSPALELMCRSGTRTSIEHAIQNAKGRIDRLIGAAWACPPRSLSIQVRHADWIALQAERAFFFNAKPELHGAQDKEDFERACELIREIPHGADWIGAREAWIERAEDLCTMGLLRLPRATTPSRVVPGN